MSQEAVNFLGEIFTRIFQGVLDFSRGSQKVVDILKEIFFKNIGYLSDEILSTICYSF